MTEPQNSTEQLLKNLEPERMRFIYKQEYDRLMATKAYSIAFDELVRRFPEGDRGVQLFLQRAYHGDSKVRFERIWNNRTSTFDYVVKTVPLLNPDELSRIKVEDSQLFNRILPIYRHYTAERAGLV